MYVYFLDCALYHSIWRSRWNATYTANANTAHSSKQCLSIIYTVTMVQIKPLFNYHKHKLPSHFSRHALWQQVNLKVCVKQTAQRITMILWSEIHWFIKIQLQLWMLLHVWHRSQLRNIKASNTASPSISMQHPKNVKVLTHCTNGHTLDNRPRCFIWSWCFVYIFVDWKIWCL